MKNSAFQKTFYLGLTLFITPVIVTGMILLLITVNSGPKPNKVQEVKEVIFPPENVIEHDTVYVEKPKPKIVPKIVEPIKVDTVKVIDTSTQTN